MKNHFKFLTIFLILPILGFAQISKYNITKENYDIVLSGSTGSDFELGSGVNMNVPSSPKATNIKAFNFDEKTKIVNSNEVSEDSNTIENSNFSIIDIKSSRELAENLFTYFKASYKFASARASYSKSKEIFESSSSVLILIENVKTGVSISEESIEWTKEPNSENSSIRTDEERLNQFLADYGSHYINSVNYGYRIAIQGSINSKTETEVVKFKAALKASFGQGSAEGGISSSQRETLTNEKVEIRCEITSGGITPQHSTVLYGFDQIYEFLKKLKKDEIKIVRGPISCSVKSYWHTLMSYQSTRILLENFKGYRASANYGLPKGTVISWNPYQEPTLEQNIEDIIPDGWAICDGSYGTPDLTDKFIMGTNSLNSVSESGGTVEHIHTGKTNNGNNNKQRTGSGGRDASDRNHSHIIYVDKTNHLPPYYKLIYLMKL